MQLKRRSRKKWIVIFIVIIIIIAYLIIDSAIRPTVFSIAEIKLKALATEAVNDAVDGVFNSGISYADLINIEKDDTGKIISISANTININYLASGISDTVQKEVANIGQQGIDIPIGTIIGGSLFSGKGPSINVQIQPVGYVNTEFLTEFEEAGINQTRHKIFLAVYISMNIVISNEIKQIDYESKQLLTDTVIVGDIPEQYLQIDGLGGMEGLAPMLLMDEYADEENTQ